jgi:hypothetical protein
MSSYVGDLNPNDPTLARVAFTAVICGRWYSVSEWTASQMSVSAWFVRSRALAGSSSAMAWFRR